MGPVGPNGDEEQRRRTPPQHGEWARVSGSREPNLGQHRVDLARVRPLATSHPPVNWPLYASRDGAFVWNTGVYLHKDTFLTTRTAFYRSIWGCAVFVSFTPIMAVATNPDNVRTIMAQCGDSPKQGIGGRFDADGAAHAVKLATRHHATRKHPEVWVEERDARDMVRTLPSLTAVTCVPDANRHRFDRCHALVRLPVQSGRQSAVCRQWVGDHRPSTAPRRRDVESPSNRCAALDRHAVLGGTV